MLQEFLRPSLTLIYDMTEASYENNPKEMLCDDNFCCESLNFFTLCFFDSTREELSDRIA